MPTPFPAVLSRPDPGTAPAAPETADATWTERVWDLLTGWTDAVPNWTLPALVGGVAVTALVAFPLLRTQAFKAGQRINRPGKQLTDDERQDRKLLLAALIPAALFWVAVLVGSGRGLIAFAEDDLKWTGGWQGIVPLTLDGVAISFGLLAFRAVKKKLNPDKATWIAWGAMLASAGLNFVHEIGGSAAGAVYLAILSVLGMLIFHEFLAQFEEGTGHIARSNPKFGLRWFTWPANTLCAWFAWRNYPPADGTRASIGNAVEHLRQVRITKALKRARTVDAPDWWIWVTPWLRTEQFTTALGELRTKLTAERKTRTRLEATHRTTVTDLTRTVEANRTEIADLSGRLTQIAADARTAEQNQMVAFDTERVALQNRVAAVQAELDRANRDRDTLTVRVDELGGHLNQQAAETAEQARVAEVNQRLAEQRFEAERTARVNAERAAQQARTDGSEQAERITVLLNQERDRNADLAEENAALREALVQGNVAPLRPRRTGSTHGRAGRTTAALDDGSALAAMFAKRPEPGFAWSAREANRITGAGLSGRAQRLAEAANQHAADCTEPDHSACFTDQTQTA